METDTHKNPELHSGDDKYIGDDKVAAQAKTATIGHPASPTPGPVFTREHVEKIEANHKILSATTMFAYNIDNKIEVLVDLLDKAGAVKRIDFDRAMDDKNGLRLKGVGEKIEEKDTVWVSYDAFIDDHETIGEKDIPVRITPPTADGRGAVWALDLVGKSPHSKCTVEKKFTDKSHPKFFGKTVKFEIEIGKVKTKVKTDG